MIISGTGRMQVGDEQRELRPGDLVFIPPRAMHGIDNTGDQPLTYVSAATPAFKISDTYDDGQPAGAI